MTTHMFLNSHNYDCLGTASDSNSIALNKCLQRAFDNSLLYIARTHPFSRLLLSCIAVYAQILTCPTTAGCNSALFNYDWTYTLMSRQHSLVPTGAVQLVPLPAAYLLLGRLLQRGNLRGRKPPFHMPDQPHGRPR